MEMRKSHKKWTKWARNSNKFNKNYRFIYDSAYFLWRFKYL